VCALAIGFSACITCFLALSFLQGRLMRASVFVLKHVQIWFVLLLWLGATGLCVWFRTCFLLLTLGMAAL
jgi:hypothetical protein